MQSRRREDYVIQSPTGKLRDRRIELGHDPYAMAGRDMMDRSRQSRRSLSPRNRNQEGSQPLLGGDRRSSSLERTYDLDIGGGRVDRVRSRSPPFGQVHRRHHYTEGISNRDLPVELRRRNELFEHTDMNPNPPNVSRGLKHEYAHEYSTSRLLREKNFDGGRFSDATGHGILVQKSMILEDKAARESFRTPADFGITSKYGGGNFSSSSANLDLGPFENEKVRYPDPLLLDKLSVMESYGREEKPIFHSKDVTYPTEPAFRSKDYLSTSAFRSNNYANTSSGISRVNFADEYPKSSVKLTEPLGFSTYSQRSISDTARDAETEHNDLISYHSTFSHPRTRARAEHQEYLYHRHEGRADDYGYPSDQLYRKVSLHERVDHEHRDLLKPSMVDSVAEHVDNTECSRRNMIDNSLWNQPFMQKQTVPAFLGMSRSSTASKHGGEYMDSGTAHLEIGKRVQKEQEMPHFRVSVDRENPNLRLDYCFGSDAGQESQRERIRSGIKYEAGIYGLAGRTQGTKAEELGTHDPSDRMLKRKYNMGEEVNRHNSRSIVSNKWNNSRTLDVGVRGEDWIGEDASVSLSSRSMGYDHKPFRKAERLFDVADRRRACASEEWLSSDDQVQEHAAKPYKPSGKYLKGHPRPGPLSCYNSSRFHKRHALPKHQNVWIRGKDDNQVDVHANEVDQSEDWVSSAKSEPPENSDEFNQLVHKAFLVFTKKLNENPAVRKRYKEQGRAGSLFCIVCSRSLSKEFMDTQRLVTHTFMSHKVGLRTQHLGLHKAICVLMGWNSTVAPDVITWVPEAISSAEALAQKEDLILWPPIIVIHNISISDYDPEARKVITAEELGDFLRGKGFGGGKIKVCLGKPANHSILVVKFLGTFSCLQDAERLHNYFAENKHGRTAFDLLATNSSKSSGTDGGVQGFNAEELVLYGYMGIAEDLDKVDFDTKRKCMVKSKKDIQDIANAPVKPE